MATPRDSKVLGVRVAGISRADVGRIEGADSYRGNDQESTKLPRLFDKAQPRIPTFGPASQLSPRVLISAATKAPRTLSDPKQLGLLAPPITKLPTLTDLGLSDGKSHERLSVAKKLQEVSAPFPTRQKRISQVAVSLATGSTTNFAGSSSFRDGQGSGKARSCQPRLQNNFKEESREMPKGLWSVLAQGDHTHRLHECEVDTGEAQANEDGIQAPFSSSPSPGKVPPDMPAEPISPSPQDSPESPRYRSRSTRVTVMSHVSQQSRAGSPAKTGYELNKRNVSLRSSFHLEEEEIDSALWQMHRFQDTTEMESATETQNPELTALLAKFEGCGIATRGLKPSKLLADPSPNRLGSLEPEEGSRSGPADNIGETASSTEISTCVAVLNLYRWLCGLPPVHLDSALLAICNLVSVSLLPRALPSAQLSADAAEFVELLVSIVGTNGGRISILQGDASLLSAVERSVNSSDSLSNISMTSVSDPIEHAKALAEQIKLRNPTAVRPPSHNSKRKFRDRKIAVARLSSYDRPMNHIEHASDLPEPLQPLGVFWDLQAGLSRKSSRKSGGHAKSPRRVFKGSCSSPLSSIWGDRNGACDFRRHMLNPALAEFGVARRHDTCVLWTSAGPAFEKSAKQRNPKGQMSARSLPQDPSPQSQAVIQRDADPAVRFSLVTATGPSGDNAAASLGAVCWPPTGILPLFLVMNRRAAWTIMPDSTRFQPTESTQIQAWRVKIERPTSGAWTADRLSEVVIKNFTVDCSNVGNPFCVIFWPDFGQAFEGYQLEVQLSGLRGEQTSLNFFYEFKDFMQKILDEHLCAEAATFRALVGDHAFWGPPRKSDAEKEVEAADSRRICSHAPKVEQPPSISLVSYQESTYTTDSVDITLVVSSEEAVAVNCQLLLVRFSGEEEEVPSGVVVQKLPPSNHFLVRAKLPLSRQRFEIRFFASTKQSPNEYRRHPFRYMITTSKNCPPLLAGLEDRRLHKFGYVPIDPVGQLHGIVVLAPSTRRIIVGVCYFLVYVDKSVAIARAMTEMEECSRSHSHRHVSQDVGHHNQVVNARDAEPDARTKATSTLFEKRLNMKGDGMSNLCQSASLFLAEQGAIVPQQPPLSDRPSDGHRPRLSNRSIASSSSRAQFATTVSQLQENLRAVVQCRTKDTGEDVHLDVVLRGGEVIHRMRERPDFPGFYECLYSFGENDIEQTIDLCVRFPRVHASEYAPKKLGSWFVCRDESLPQNF